MITYSDIQEYMKKTKEHLLGTDSDIGHGHPNICIDFRRFKLHTRETTGSIRQANLRGKKVREFALGEKKASFWVV